MKVPPLNVKARCYLITLASFLGGTWLLSAAITNWDSVREFVRICITLGGFQWAPAVISLISVAVVYGIICSSESDKADLTLGAQRLYVAAWAVGAFALLFTFGDWDTITVFQCVAGLVSGLFLFAAAFMSLIAP